MKKIIKFTVENIDREATAKLIIDDGGAELSKILLSTDFYYYMIPLELTVKKDVRLNVSKIPDENLYYIVPSNLSSFEGWFQKHLKKKNLFSSLEIEEKVNQFINYYQIHCVFG